MKFLCLICAEKVMEHMPETEAQAHFQEYAEFTERIRMSGHFVGANRLKPPDSAITVRVRDGKISTTDGPFAETKELIGGYYMIEASDQNAAIEVAAQIPGARFGCVEVRPVADDALTRSLAFDTPAQAKRDDKQQLATGSFEVITKPLPAADPQAAPCPGRMSLDKRFSGDLIATGKGEMLTAISETPGSAGYVAIEHVSGTLHGHAGSFAFQHTGALNRGAQALSISVVPDTGTGELTGIAGHFSINIVDGKHHYEFVYTLP